MSPSSLKKNIGYNFLYQLLILILPLVTAPYLSRVIGAEGIGAYSYSNAIALYFVYFVMMGLNNYGNRVIAACQDDKRKRTKEFWSIYAMQAACFLVASIAYTVYSVLFAQNRLIALIQGLFVLSSLFDINWFFFGMEQFKLTVIRNTLIKVATVVCIFVFIRSESDICAYVLIMCVGTLMSQIVLWPFLRRYVGLYRPRLRDVLPHFKPNSILFVSVLAISIYNTLSKVLLGYVGGVSEVGYFDNAAKIVAVPVALIGAVGTVMLPRTSSLLSKGEAAAIGRHTEVTMLLVLAFSFFSAWIIPSIAFPFVEIFYGLGFERSAQALIVLCATIPLLGFGNVMRTQYLIPRSRDSVYLLSAFFGALVSVVVNIVLIPSIGCVGAAFASVAAELAVLACQCFCIKGDFPLRRFGIYALSFFAVGFMMHVVIHFLPPTGWMWLDVLMRVCLGSLVYLILATPAFVCVRKRFGIRRNA